jgi:hypothetical protein
MKPLVVVTGGQSRDRQGRRRGISFDAYCERLGNPDFISAEELAESLCFAGKSRSGFASATLS